MKIQELRLQKKKYGTVKVYAVSSIGGGCNNNVERKMISKYSL